MNLKEIEAIENVLVRNALLKAWYFAENTVGEYGCDIHNKLYNEEAYTISIPQAEKDVEDLGVWDCLELVKAYEDFNFGKVFTQLEPFKVANMVYYILGEHILNKAEALLDQFWNDALTEKQVKEVQSELRQAIREIDSWASVWHACLDEWE